MIYKVKTPNGVATEEFTNRQEAEFYATIILAWSKGQYKIIATRKGK
jgi:succinyl-CoA synthetase beta subunit